MKTMDWRKDVFRLAEFVVDPKRNRVTGPNGETALQPKVIDVLCALAARQGEVLSRDELIDAVWGKEFGADESLTRAISQLRKMFGDTRDEPRVIETIPKRGYRLIAAPAFVEGGPVTTQLQQRRWLIPGALLAAVLAAAIIAFAMRAPQELPARSERTGIVVTVEPFASDDRTLPMAGFADELSAELADSPLIRARSGTAPEPAGAGTLQYRLRGEIHRAGHRLRISARLIDATSGEIVWGENYEQPYDPQFSARNDVLATVSRDSLLPLLRAAKAHLINKPPLHLQPWEATLLVTWVTGDEGRPAGPPVEDSYWLQRHALEIDPNFAPAHALFAELASYHALFHPPFDTEARRKRARHHAERALELAPYDAEVLYQLSLHYRFSGDRDRAEAALQRVLQLQPNHPLARIDLDFVRGQCAANSDAVLADLKTRIDELPPSSPARWVGLAHLSAMRLSRGEYEQAREAALASRRIVPMTWTAYTLAAADAATGRTAEARQVLADHRREWPDMDLGYFADHIAQRWCLDGPRSPEAKAIFRRLAEEMRSAQK